MKCIFQAARVARMVFAVASLITVALLSGCASLVNGGKDALYVEITNCGEPISCKASNKKGAWRFTAPGSVQFTKSDNPLTIACQDGNATLKSQVTPRRGGWLNGGVWVLANIWPFLGIGFFVDAATDAHWSMLDSVSLHREYCRGKKTNP
ncbi:MAG: hypothetical protein MPL62_15505 [Alphaproteobacteria bacterium]|nr:hypothetical protein [Alphaproteobacteria bacterium]